MAILAFLLFALVGSAAAQIRAPIKVNICAPVGNNVHSTLTVLSTELSNYPGHVKGACSKVCSTVCKDMLREVNAAGQCICKGSALKCGANAKPSNDKKSCKCLVGFKGNPLKECVDINECAAVKSPCAAETECVNTAGSFQCKACGKNANLENGKCQCHWAFRFGDVYDACCQENASYIKADNECVCNKGFQGLFDGEYRCLPSCGHNAFRTTANGECKCHWAFQFGNPNEACCQENASFITRNNWSGCECNKGFQDLFDGKYHCLPSCGHSAHRKTVNGECECRPWTPFGNPNEACCQENATFIKDWNRCACNEGFNEYWAPNAQGPVCIAL